MGVELVNEPTADPAQVTDGATVTITARVKATSAGQLTAGFRRADDHAEPSVDQQVTADEEVDVQREVVVTKDTAGVYELWAKLDDTAATFDRASVDLSLPGDDDENPPTGTEGADLRGLVWDPNFATSTGVIGCIVLAAVTAVAVVASLFLIDKKMTPDDIAGVVALLGVIIAATAVIGGTWIVAMEFRGRANLAKDGEARGSLATTKGAITDKMLESLGKLVEGFAKLRSPIAVLVAGAVVFIAAAVLAGSGSTDEDAPPTSPPSVDQPTEPPTETSADEVSATAE